MSENGLLMINAYNTILVDTLNIRLQIPPNLKRRRENIHFPTWRTLGVKISISLSFFSLLKVYAMYIGSLV